MFVFDRVYFLFLLLFSPITIYLKYFWKNRGGRIVFTLGIWNQDVFKSGKTKFLKTIFFFSNVLYIIGVVFLILSLAGISFSKKEKVFLNRGMDIVFVVDQSPSMSAKDFGEKSRLESIKDIISDFVDKRENDAVGLVSFASDAAVQIPPTTDYKAFKKKLNNIKIAELGNGTSIGLGLSVATLHLSKSNSKNKVIVLLTDGADTKTDIHPMAAVEAAKELGIRIYAIGIGSEKDTEFEYIDPKTELRVTGFTGGAFDEKLLKSIGKASGGRYYTASGVLTLDGVFSSIDIIETNKSSIKIKTIKKDMHREFILLGFIFIVLSFFINHYFFREIF